MYCFADTETTGLPKPLKTVDGVILSDNQPYMVEIYMECLDKDLKTFDKYHTYVQAPVASDIGAFKVHGLTEEFLSSHKQFNKKIFKKMQKQFDQCEWLVAQNLPFDYSIMFHAANRIGKSFKFPKKLFCTVEQSNHIKGRRLKQEELYSMATGGGTYDAHKARVDVGAMITVYKWLNMRRQ